ALLHLVESADHVDRGALARAALAHQANHLARRDREADLLEHRFVGLVAEGHVLELHTSFDASQRHRLFGVLHVGGGIEHLEDTLRGSQRAREKVRHAAHELDRKSTRLNSSHVSISYAVFCLKKKKKT